MSGSPLKDFGDRLIRRGFSRSYVRRICNELTDHYYCLLEQSGSHSKAVGDLEHIFDSQIGSSDTIVELIEKDPALVPWQRRFALGIYVALPAFLLATLSIFVLVIATQYRSTLVDPNNQFGQAFLNSIPLIFYSLLPALGVWFALRYQVHWIFQVMLAMVVSANSLFVTSCVSCQLTGNTLLISLWRFDALSFLVPWAVSAIVFFAVIGWRLIRSRASATRQSPMIAWKFSGLFNIDARQVLGGIGIASVFSIAFFLLAESLASTNQKHPVENLVKKFNSQPAESRRLIMAVREMGKTDQLGLNDTQQASIQRLLDELDSQKTVVPQQAKTDKKSVMRFYGQHDQVFNATARDIEGLLNDDQRTKVCQYVYQQHGWRVLMFDEVREHLEIDRYQFLLICDLYRFEIKQRNSFGRRWRAAEPNQREEIRRSIEQFNAEMSQKFRQLLSGTQLKRLNEMRGMRDSRNSALVAKSR